MSDKKLQMGYPEEQDLQVPEVRILRQLREKDERHAWDTYCASSPYSDPKLQAVHADIVLEERRKRWGGV
jgi:hypothetical protein